MEKTKNNTFLNVAVIGLKLLLICAVIAGIVSFVYDLTLERYEANIQETKNKAIGQIFGKEGIVWLILCCIFLIWKCWLLIVEHAE